LTPPAQENLSQSGVPAAQLCGCRIRFRRALLCTLPNRALRVKRIALQQLHLLRAKVWIEIERLSYLLLDRRGSADPAFTARQDHSKWPWRAKFVRSPT